MNNYSEESQRLKITVDDIFLLCITIFFALFFILTLSMGATAGRVPRLITGVGFLLCLVQFIQSKRIKTNKKDEEQEVYSGIPMYRMLLAVIAYIASLQVIGFIITTFAFLFGVPKLMQYNNTKVILIFSTIATIVLYFSFVNFFNVRLPEGLLFEML